MKTIRSKIIIFSKGFCMGIADVIPGVSGGTVAFLMGIYEELIESISSFDTRFLKTLVQGKIASAFSKTNWKFLSILLSGILSAIFFLSHGLKWLLVNQTVFVYAFFFGIIFATVFVIAGKVKKKDFFKVLAGIVSAGVMFQLAGALPLQTPETAWFLFLSGAIAICAMILPGISGAFILLLLGKYEFVITAVSERNLGVLLVVAAGCCAGLLCFVRVLRWLLRCHYDLTLSVLAGIVLGSLRRVWPWKETLSQALTQDGKIIALKEVNVLPSAMTGQVIVALVLFLLGMLVSLWLAAREKKDAKGLWAETVE